MAQSSSVRGVDLHRKNAAVFIVKNAGIPVSRFVAGAPVRHGLQPVLGVRPGLFKPASAGLLGRGL